MSLQENSGIQTDIPTENEILGISSGYSEETQNLVSSEFPRNIPTEFRGNINPSEYSYGIPRKNLLSLLSGDLPLLSRRYLRRILSKPTQIMSNDYQTRRRQRRGRGGTGSQSRDSSHFQDSPSPHSSYHTSLSAAPAPAPLAPATAPAPAPPGPSDGCCGVGSTARSFNRSGNEISAWINRMMYSALDKRHLTFTDFPTDKQHLWFQFNWNSDETLFIYHHFVHKVMDNYGKQIHEWKKKWEINKGQPFCFFILFWQTTRSGRSCVRIGIRSGRSCVRIGIRKRRKKLLPPTPPTAGATVKGRASSSITWVLNLLPLWGIAR
ncbi:hypothetical protein YC2023_075907 [Brassica napus]